MAQNQLRLLATRRFLPLFVAQFGGAVNDNLFLSGLIVLLTYKVATQPGVEAAVLAPLAEGLSILPFFLFSATAGQIADKFEKARLIRLVKLIEIVIMTVGAVAFLVGDPYVLLALLFVAATRSAFFGPLKYSILPDHLRREELIAGNGFIEAATNVAILLGWMAGSLLILTPSGPLLVGASMIGLAGLGWAASLFIPSTVPAAPTLVINPNLAAETWKIIQHASIRTDIRLSILGISWFWSVGAVFLSQFPMLAKEVLHANEQAVALFLTAFAIGTSVGSLWCNRLLKGEVSAKYVPFGALGMAVFALDMYLAARTAPPVSGDLLDALDVLSGVACWRILIDLFLLSTCGGLYVVPLYAIVQQRSDESHRSRIVASNNIINALFVVAAVAVTIALVKVHFDVAHIVLALGIANLCVATYICRLLPDAVAKAVAARLFRIFYRAEVKGLEHYKAAGDRAVVIVNHVSFLDGALLAAFLPGAPIFAIDSFTAEKWWAKLFLWLVETYPINPTKPFGTKGLIKKVQHGRKCVIFPEGRITITGAVMKVYEGPGLIADKTDAPVIPVRIDGAQYTPFSRLKGKVRLRWFPKITITILPPRAFRLPPGQTSRQRRQLIGSQLYDLMTEVIFQTCNRQQTLFSALLDARAVHGGSMPIVEDIQRGALTYGKLISSSFVLGRRMASAAPRGEYVGILLPNSTAAAVSFFALQAFGRVPAMLNLSTGTANMVAACKTGPIKTVLTSREFIEVARLQDAAGQLGNVARIVYLEDLRAEMGVVDKLLGLAAPVVARPLHHTSRARPSDPAVLLFTSGSEGTPKGVVLSHANLLANRYQLSARVDFNSTDVAFNALPIFHSFGLSGGLLLPLLSGVRTILYPSPLHYRIVPEMIYQTNATITFGTDTFLRGYARAAHPYDLHTVRYVFAGAEAVKEETRRLWVEKFGLRILEGYGATEASPVIATNTSMQCKSGTVGRVLPGIRCRIDPVDGLHQGGRLFISGPNVMLGYLRVEHPGRLEAPASEWYDTGDIADMDEHGYVSIIGRAKRFAKIAGEMVSLTAIEDFVSAVWPDCEHAAISIPDSGKGERVVLVTEHDQAARDVLVDQARVRGLATLLVPDTVIRIARMPKLGTGKTDYISAKTVAMQSAEKRIGAAVGLH